MNNAVFAIARFVSAFHFASIIFTNPINSRGTVVKTRIDAVSASYKE